METHRTSPARPAPPHDPRREFVEIYGSALVTVNYLRVGVVLLSLACVGLVAFSFYTERLRHDIKPLVIRIDEVGRAQAVQYDTLTYAPKGNAPELKYFLVQFVTRHYGRMRASIRTAYPESLLFLDATIAERLMTDERRDGDIDTFLADASDEVEIRVRNVSFQQLASPPYRATVDFEKVFYRPGGTPTSRSETFVAQITFELRDKVPSALIPVNPLGLTITELRLDQAFR